MHKTLPPSAPDCVIIVAGLAQTRAAKPLPFPLVNSALLAMCVLIALAAASFAERPNVVLCMADDQGWGDVGYYKKSIAKTPVLDEMARNGLRLDRFYAAAPVCSPTRGSVLTGRHPNRYGCFQWGHSLRPQEVTIAEEFKRAGYATGHFGKWHLGSVDARSDVSPGSSGFDRWFSAFNFYDNNPLMSSNGKVVKVTGESSVVAMDQALNFIRNCQQQKKPFLAVVWFGSPHDPHRAAERYRRLYPDQSKRDQHYYGEISGIDDSMGMLRKELRKLGIADNTVVWYTSDNGPQGPQRRKRPGSSGGLRDRKGTIWEGGIRVPAIIEWPRKITKARESRVPTGTVDIYPTLLDLIGRKQPNHQPVLDGISLLPLINDKMKQRSRPLGFWNYRMRGTPMHSDRLLKKMKEAHAQGKQLPLHNTAATRRQRINQVLRVFQQKGFVGHAAWINNQYKLHRIANPRSGKVRYEMYDLTKDPAERRDLAKQIPDQVVQLKRELQAWQESIERSLRGRDYK